jgi:predicted nucleic acid-binding protein
MTCSVDTSAFYAAMDADDRNRRQAARQWAAWLAEQGFECLPGGG